MKMIKLNKIVNYGNVTDDYMIEDKGFMPKVFNTKTGNEIPWTKSGRSPLSIHVMTKNGKGTNVAIDVIRNAYDERHFFD